MKKFKKSNLEKQIHNLPEKVQWCKLCTISNQRPKIIFDDNGVCSACTYNLEYKKKIDWKQREDELKELLSQHRRKDGYWDVVVPSSGGKDSGFVAHMLKHKYDMHPLSVTWSPLSYTQIGWENFQAKIASGFTNILCSPNGKFQRKLARLCLEELGDAFHVFVLGQMHCPLHIAEKFEIPLIFHGENGSLEYAGDPKIADIPYLPLEKFIDNYLKSNDIDELINFGLKNKDYLSKKDFSQSDLFFYRTPSIEKLKSLGIKGHYYFSYFHKWNPQENFYYCIENTGYKPNPERSEGTYSKYASLDDKMDGFHYYLRYIKFGLGRCMEDTAHEIRSKHISRNEGIALMKKYEGEFPKKYFDEFLEYLGITEKHFWEIIESWRDSKLWKKNIDDKWELSFPIK